MNNIISSKITCFTERGLSHTENEDSLFIADPTTGLMTGRQLTHERAQADYQLMMSVSDGVGGNGSGKIASNLVNTTLQTEWPNISAQHPLPERIKVGIEAVNRAVRQQQKWAPEMQSMATTLTLALINGNNAFIASVGDSRAYLLRRGQVTQLTVDQTMAQYLIDQGFLSLEEANTKPDIHMLLQSLGGEDIVRPDILSFELYRDDTLLLCSDGLTCKLTSKEIGDIILRSNSADEAIASLVKLTLMRGSTDDISVILANFTGDGLPVAIDAQQTPVLECLANFDIKKSRSYRKVLSWTMMRNLFVS